MGWMGIGLITCLTLALSGGCQPDTNVVVVYTALDQDFSEPLLAAFTEKTGIQVLAKYDTESTKTVGLTNALIAESARPRCDVFWNNEILNTLRLKQRGLLAPYEPPTAGLYPDNCQDPDHYWHGFAARARVILVNKRLDPTERPQSVRELAAAKWKDRVGIAKPLFGTTATHAAVLFSEWGNQEAEAFFKAVRKNARVLSGNKQVALAVATGQLDWGLTDTDDAMIEQAKGMPVDIIYPDQPSESTRTDAMGTLFIPNCLAIMKDCPHPEAAQQLVDYLLRPEIERKLAASPSAQIPLAKSIDPSSPEIQGETPGSITPMKASWPRAADQWNQAAAFLQEEFARSD